MVDSNEDPPMMGTPFVPTPSFHFLLQCKLTDEAMWEG